MTSTQLAQMYESTSDAVKAVILAEIVKAIHSCDSSAWNGAAVSVTGQNGIKAATKMPNTVLAIGLQYGRQTGALSTHKHDTAYVAAAAGYVLLPYSDNNRDYYVACVALRTN